MLKVTEGKRGDWGEGHMRRHLVVSDWFKQMGELLDALPDMHLLSYK